MKTKKKAVRKPKPKWKSHKCHRAGCKAHTVYMKRNRKTGKMEHWCAPHFREDVEIPQGIVDRRKVKKAREGFERRSRKSGIKGAANKATKKKVVRKVKK